jgi:hypothetical protein
MAEMHPVMTGEEVTKPSKSEDNSPVKKRAMGIFVFEILYFLCLFTVLIAVFF